MNRSVVQSLEEFFNKLLSSEKAEFIYETEVKDSIK
jgi:hypothetical protein